MIITMSGVKDASTKHSIPCFEAFPEIQFEPPVKRITSEPSMAIMPNNFFMLPDILYKVKQTKYP